jgi:hypothetical protein
MRQKHRLSISQPLSSMNLLLSAANFGLSIFASGSRL